MDRSCDVTEPIPQGPSVAGNGSPASEQPVIHQLASEAVPTGWASSPGASVPEGGRFGGQDGEGACALTASPPSVAVSETEGHSTGAPSPGDRTLPCDTLSPSMVTTTTTTTTTTPFQMTTPTSPQLSYPQPGAPPVPTGKPPLVQKRKRESSNVSGRSGAKKRKIGGEGSDSKSKSKSKSKRKSDNNREHKKDKKSSKKHRDQERKDKKKEKKSTRDQSKKGKTKRDEGKESRARGRDSASDRDDGSGGDGGGGGGGDDETKSETSSLGSSSTSGKSAKGKDRRKEEGEKDKRKKKHGKKEKEKEKKDKKDKNKKKKKKRKDKKDKKKAKKDKKSRVGKGGSGKRSTQAYDESPSRKRKRTDPADASAPSASDPKKRRTASGPKAAPNLKPKPKPKPNPNPNPNPKTSPNPKPKTDPGVAAQAAAEPDSQTGSASPSVTPSAFTPFREPPGRPEIDGDANAPERSAQGLVGTPQQGSETTRCERLPGSRDGRCGGGDEVVGTEGKATAPLSRHESKACGTDETGPATCETVYGEPDTDGRASAPAASHDSGARVASLARSERSDGDGGDRVLPLPLPTSGGAASRFAVSTVAMQGRGTPGAADELPGADEEAEAEAEAEAEEKANAAYEADAASASAQLARGKQKREHRRSLYLGKLYGDPSQPRITEVVCTATHCTVTRDDTFYYIHPVSLGGVVPVRVRQPEDVSRSETYINRLNLQPMGPCYHCDGTDFGPEGRKVFARWRDRLTGTYVTWGNFCDFPCALGYAAEHLEHLTQYIQMSTQRMAAEIWGRKLPIRAAAPRICFSRYGGHVPEGRASTYSEKVYSTIHEAAMVSYAMMVSCRPVADVARAISRCLDDIDSAGGSDATDTGARKGDASGRDFGAADGGPRGPGEDAHIRGGSAAIGIDDGCNRDGVDESEEGEDLQRVQEERDRRNLARNAANWPLFGRRPPSAAGMKASASIPALSPLCVDDIVSVRGGSVGDHGGGDTGVTHETRELSMYDEFLASNPLPTPEESQRASGGSTFAKPSPRKPKATRTPRRKSAPLPVSRGKGEIGFGTEIQEAVAVEAVLATEKEGEEEEVRACEDPSRPTASGEAGKGKGQESSAIGDPTQGDPPALSVGPTASTASSQPHPQSQSPLAPTTSKATASHPLAPSISNPNVPPQYQSSSSSPSSPATGANASARAGPTSTVVAHGGNSRGEAPRGGGLSAFMKKPRAMAPPRSRESN